MRRPFILLVVIAIVVVAIHSISPYRYDLQDKLSYSTRPLWDVSEAPRHAIVHTQAAGVATDDADACQRHGLSHRQGSAMPSVWDATFVNTELDLLEIRLRELWPVVDKFLIAESTHTMTGIKKATLHFQQHREVFKAFESKIVYTTLEGRNASPSDGLFTLANEQRQAMSRFIESNKPPEDTLLIMSDVDEIPRRAAVELIKACLTPLPIHLQLQNFVYSYEFTTLADSWRAQIHRWSDAKEKFGYTHGKSSEDILTGAGWHCSFCFRTLAEFKMKILSASHIDRLLKRPNYRSYLTDKSIQDRICNGKDLLDVPPEVYTWSDLVGLWKGAHRQLASVDVPASVVQEWRRFSFLLPGHCQREPGGLDPNVAPESLRVSY